MRLLTLPAVAEQLAVSVSLVQKMTRAAQYADEVRSGTRARDDVPPGLVPYLDSGFPIPVMIGKTIRRIRADQLNEWLSASP